jgi:hypothetical protein
MPIIQESAYYLRRAHGLATRLLKRLTNSLDPKSMRNEINRLVNTVSDPVAKKVASRLCLISLALNKHPRTSVRICNRFSVFLPGIRKGGLPGNHCM